MTRNGDVDVILILPMGIALILRGSGTLNSIVAILEIVVIKEDPIKEARNAAKNAVANMGNERDPRSRPSWRSYSPEIFEN